ncbi:right-handed parallel beta-helix repeat-containing protein [Fontisphaera persica]|uniref:right-handed parallel beta-helix repeat-containing protein n=1 Tax=Fontisphaera persica TaxID=2974023 RepID=UPI0024C0245D|nr:right-handed parallel beta-helix repeat-containing protein [Fontisphaera persica]WCJ60772.1 right-handed parallel beta-helix repeat-containing protein [Fontisphaera persica]
MAGVLPAQVSNGLFSVQWGLPTPASRVLVAHDDAWHYRLGTNAPQANWTTLGDSQLDATWTVARGGFGFGDAGIAGENTTVNVANICSTLYLRRTFQVTEPLDPAAILRLVVDYDDGFVAYLDGVEIARANLTNAAGTAVLHTATTGGRSHEASCCNPPTNPAETFTVGPVGDRLAPGEHVLAIIAVNQSLGSSDMHIIAELRLDPPSSSEVHGAFFSIVGTRGLTVRGQQQLPGARWVVIQGEEFAGPSVPEMWQVSVPLSPVVNRLSVQVTDGTGHILGETNRLVILRTAETLTGGTLASNTIWRAGSVVRLTNGVVIPPNGSLTLEPGVVVLAEANVVLRGTNVVLRANGTEDQPILWLPADGSNTNWGGIALAGTNTSLHLQHLDMLGGYVDLRDGAQGLLEDCFLHDYHGSSPPIIQTVGTPKEVTIVLRRCHIARYHELLLRLSHVTLEDCLLEYLDYSGDGIDFDGARPGSQIRRTTVRRGTIYNTDALDLGEYSPTEPSRGVLVADCLLHDFVDKGVSMGAYVEVTVSNCVIYNVESGISVKDSSLAAVYQTTVAAADYGIRNYNKANTNAPTGGGAITSSWNNIFWNLQVAAVSLLNGSSLEAEYSDFQNTNWPGAGNVSQDPLFVNAARHNYRLATNSPLLAAGRDGAPMGAVYPVGGIPAAPAALEALRLVPGAVTLRWQDDADNEEEFEVQRSTDRRQWQTIGSAEADMLEFLDEAPLPNTRVYYRVRARNRSGVSPWSAPAGAYVIGAPALMEARLKSEGGLSLKLSAVAGTEVVLEGSSDLQTWQELTATNALGGWVEISDPESSRLPCRFYRVRLSR